MVELEVFRQAYQRGLPIVMDIADMQECILESLGLHDHRSQVGRRHGRRGLGLGVTDLMYDLRASLGAIGGRGLCNWNDSPQCLTWVGLHDLDYQIG